MTCPVSNQIADYCNRAEEIYCPCCGSTMTHNNDDELVCDDSYNEDCKAYYYGNEFYEGDE